MKRLAGVVIPLVLILGLAPAALAQEDGDHCPDDALGNDAGPGAPPGAVNGSSGSITLDGVTVSWSGTSVTVSGGTATFCVKGGTSGNTGVVTRPPGTYTTAELGLVGPQGQSQTVSYLIVYDTTSGSVLAAQAETNLTSGSGSSTIPQPQSARPIAWIAGLGLAIAALALLQPVRGLIRRRAS